MKIFLTGATGYVGRAVGRALAGAGHQVTGLLRSAEKSSLVTDELGGRPVYGDMTIPASYRGEAAEHDVLVHCAFDEERDPIGSDRTALDALLDAARLGDRPRLVIYTSGCWVLGDTGGETVDESEPPDDPADVVAWRPRHEEICLEAGEGDGFATAVIRPGLVYGGEGGLTARLFATAEEEGAAEIPCDGEQHWSFVHREDLGRLYLQVAEEGEDGIFHGVDDLPLPAATAARAASEAAGAGGRVRTVPLEEAREQLGPVADALCLDQRLTARRSVDLGWSPKWPSFGEAAGDAYREWTEAGRPGAG